MIVWTEKAERHWQKRYGKRNTKKAWTEAFFCNEPIEFSTDGLSLYQCFLEREWIVDIIKSPQSDKNKKIRWRFIQAKLKQGFNKREISKMLNIKPCTIEDWVINNKELSKEYGEIKWKKRN